MSTQNMPAEADPLRRSKRNKFHLDVAGMHLGKRASSTGSRDEKREISSVSVSPQPPALSPQPNKSDEDRDDADTEERRRGCRVRKIPQRIASCYTHDDSSDDEESSLSTGQFGCEKCPMKFTSKGGLSNHAKMHTERRSIGCESRGCNFSCGSTKAFRLHKKAHSLFPYWEPANPDANGSTSTSNPTAHASSPSPSNSEADVAAGLRIDNVLDSMVKKEQAVSRRPGFVRRSMPVNGSTTQTQTTVPRAPATITRPIRNMSELAAKNNGMRAVGSEANISNMCSEKESPNVSNLKKSVLKRASSGVITSNSAPRPAASDEMPRLVAIDKIGKQFANDSSEMESPVSSRNRYVCKDCPFRTHMKVRLDNHIVGHTRDTGVKCMHCSYRCDSTSYIKRHESLHDDDAAPLLSKECAVAQDSSPRKFINQKIAGEWARYERVDDKGQYKCSIVGCVFNTRFVNRLLAHKREKHDFPAGSPLHCPLCALRLSSYGAKRVHLLRKHTRKQISRKMIDFYMRERLGERKIMSAPVKMEVGTPEEEEKDMKMDSTDNSPDSSFDSEIPVLAPEIQIREELVEAAEEEERPRQSTSSPAGIKCQQCPFLATNRNDLRRHQAKHIIKGEYQCPHCTFSCRSYKYLEAHLNVHKPNLVSSPRSAELTDSAIGTTSSESFAPEVSDSSVSGGFHRSVSLPTLPTLIPVVTIDESVKQESPSKKDVLALKLALENRKSANDLRFIDDDGIRREKCPSCPYSTRHFGDMKAHRLMHEGEPRKFACKTCTYSTKRFMSLKAHMLLHGKKVKKEKGRIVSHRFFGKMATRSGPSHARHYNCQRCLFTAKNISELWAHFRRHIGPVTSGSLLCPHCNFKSVNRSVWIAHQEMHPGSTIVSKSVDGLFKCKECPYSAETYSRLWNHLQKHKKPSKVKCSMCSYSTGTPFSLQQHVSLHIMDQKKSYTENLHNGIQSLSSSSSTPSSTQFVIGGKRKSTPLQTPKRSETNTPVVFDNGESRDACSSRSSQLGLSCASTNNAPSQPDVTEKSAPATPLAVGPMKFPDPSLVARLMRRSVPTHMKRAKRDVDECSESSSTSSSVVFKCPDVDCPYSDEDQTMFDLHLQMHAGPKRHYKCNLCTYSSFTPEALHRHFEHHCPDMKRVATVSSRRMARLSTEVIPEGAYVYYCETCSFKTAFDDRYKSHLLSHTQTIASRLMTQIKRNNNTSGEQEWKKPRLHIDAKKNDKDYQCTKCGFFCQSLSTYERHKEMHEDKCTFTCAMCDYSSETHNVVLFHEMYHHLDQPLTHLAKASSLDPENHKVPATPATVSEQVRLVGQVLTCKRCDWSGFEMAAYSAHFSKYHVETKDDKETALYLSLDMVPVASILTSASA